MIEDFIAYAQNDVNDKLKDLYNPCFNRFIKYERYPDSAYPFLLSASDSYINADFKIMICGQETNGWGGEVENDDMDFLMTIYNSFITKDDYNSPYWNMIRRIRNMSDYNKKNVGWIYNNVVKIGKADDKGCDDDINNWAIKNFNVLGKEINILKPDLLIFFSGLDYDWRIKLLLGDFSTENIPEGDSFKLCKLDFNNKSLPHAYRCYHPGGILRKKLYWEAIDVLCGIIAQAIGTAK